jgi:short-subunit dehydrogenase
VPRPLEQAVVVITGASSGIGRAAALRIARRGGSLALCARNEGPLTDVAAEHAVRAFSECLQGELASEPDIHVAAVVPQAVDTPIFEHAGNYTGRQVRPIPPVLDPEEVAAGIEACAEDPLREVSYGRAGRGLEVLHAAAPPLYRRLAHPAFVQGTWGELPADPAPGNVLGSTGPHQVEGGWRSRRRGALRRAFLAAGGGALSGVLRKNS